MRATRNEIPVLFGADPAALRGVEWGQLRAGVASLPAGADMSALLRGLPNDMCHCPHWGYVIKGRMRVIYADREESLAAGDLFYLPPGHSAIIEEDVEFVEFSPPHEHDEVIEVLKRNAAAAAQIS